MTLKTREAIRAYDDIQSREATVYQPESVEDLKELVGSLDSKSEKVVSRGAGHSFDGHSLADAVVCLRASAFRFIGAIEVVEENLARVEVGAGVDWGTLLRHVEPRGWIPFSVVTTSDATVGGTLAAHCLSRFSGVFGKECDHVAWFEIVTARGEVKRCRREDPAESDEGRLFRAALGGFGLLGVITRACIELGRVSGDPGAPVRVGSTVEFYGPHRSWTWDELLGELQGVCEEGRRRWSEARASGRVPPMEIARTAFATVSFLRSWRAIFTSTNAFEARAALIRSRYERTPDHSPMAVHEPANPARPLAELAMVNPTVNEFMQELFMMSSDGRRFEDTLDGFTFFFDGNTHARRLAREHLGVPLLLRQQTFILPAVGETVRFIAAVEAEIARSPYGAPTLMDILWLPRDERVFLLSSTRVGGGFAVSLAYEHFDHGLIPYDREAWLAFTARMFRNLASVCVALGGRVHLVKSVLASSGDIRSSVGSESLEEFFAQKQRFDPRGTFESDFLRDVLEPARKVSPFESAPGPEREETFSIIWDDIAEERAARFKARVEALFGRRSFVSVYDASKRRLSASWDATPASMTDVTFRAVLYRLLERTADDVTTG